jgi:hypothetical protein
MNIMDALKFPPPSPASGGQTQVQTGKIVYKTNRAHGLHYTARRIFYAVESDKPDGYKERTYTRRGCRTS